MDPLSHATARARAYALWGQLVLDGPSPELLPSLRALPVLAEVLPNLDADRLAAAHHDALGFQVLPWESVFLTADGLLGGPVAAEVATLYRRAGVPHPDHAEPDHLGVQLLALGVLSAREAHALASGDDPVPVQELARILLDDHLLRWLPPLVLALRDHADPFWTTVGETALELAAAHRGDLPGAPLPFTLPAPPPLLDDPKTGLRRLARAWSHPAISGVYLGPGVLGRIAASAEVPGGFGGRAQRLQAMLLAASDHGRLPDLLDALDAHLTRATGGYRELGALGVGVEPWIERVDRTRADLARLRSAAS